MTNIQVEVGEAVLSTIIPIVSAGHYQWGSNIAVYEAALATSAAYPLLPKAKLCNVVTEFAQDERVFLDGGFG